MSPQLAPGKMLDRYRMEEKLGEGGMGRVFRAVDTRLGRTVAIKVVNAEFTKRFEHEARAISALNHPHICTLHDVGEHEGSPYLVMEYVEGKPLKGPLPLGDSLRYAVQVGQALEAAHKAGIVHRDLKPDNILLNGEGSVKVLDFGLAKLQPRVEPDAATLTLVTEEGAVAGTGPYMSPEQARGEAVDSRSDIFSFGAVLYELLSGRQAFRRETLGATLAAVMTAEPPPLRETPPEVSRIVTRMLAKQREDRYQSAEELLADLEEVAQADHHFLPRRLWFIQRLPWLPLGAAALALALALAGGSIWLSRGTGGNPSNPAVAAVAPRDALRQAQEYLQRYDRKGNVDRAVDILLAAAEVDPSSAAVQACLAEAYVRRYRQNRDTQWIKAAIESGRRAVAANGFLEAGHIALGMALFEGGQKEEAAGQFERARELNPLSSPVHLGLAKLSSGADAEQLYLKAIQYGRDWITLGELALFYHRSQRYDESIKRWREALQLSPDNVLVLGNLGGDLNLNGQYAEAGNAFQDALKYDETNERTLANLGTARYFQRDYKDAVKAFKKATELAPNIYKYWGNLGDSYRWVEGLRGEAGAAYEEAIKLALERLATTPNDVEIRGSLAVYLAKSGDTSRALAELAQVEKLPGSDNGSALFKAALVYEFAGDHGRALKALERAIRAGYSRLEIANEPELAALRSDPGYPGIAGAGASRKK